MDERLFRSFASACLFVLSAALFDYFFPTYVIRPLLTGGNLATAYGSLLSAGSWKAQPVPRSHNKRSTIYDLLDGHHVVDAMRRDYTSISSDITLERLITEHILGNG